MGNNRNMIQVDGAYIKTPSSLSWGLQDISAEDAGRTDDTIMHKNRVGQKRKLDLGWQACTPDEAHEVLSAFNPEYVNVTYWDPLDNATVTRNFYTGDKEAPVKMWTVGKKLYEKISFSVIEV